RLRVGKRAENKRSAAASSDPNDNIAISYSPFPHGQCACALLVFCAFHAAIKRRYAAGDYPLHEIGWHAKSRRNLARVEYPNAPTASSPDVKQAATISE